MRNGSSLTRTDSLTADGSVARSIVSVSRTMAFSSCAFSTRGSYRLKVRICSTRFLARAPLMAICASRFSARWPAGRSIWASATLPRIASRMLLKSWAMPPAKVPIASIFCASRIGSSSALRMASADLRSLMSC